MKGTMTVNPKIIFLDIDGVLQPLSAQDRFNHDMDGLKERLARESDEGYGDLNKYDIAAVYYDWHEKAVENLRSLCEKSGAEIVISSEWRTSKTLDQLKLLFRIHTLDQFVTDVTDKLSHYARDIQIEEYLIQHPEIDLFVVIDDSFDSKLERRYPEQFVHCDTYSHRMFDKECHDKALAIIDRAPSEKESLEALKLLDDVQKNAKEVIRAEFPLRKTTLIRRRKRISADELLDELCDVLATNTHLEEIAIQGVGHDFPIMENYGRRVGDKIGKAIFKNSSVKRLDLSDNSLDDISGLIASLEARETKLELLDLRKNRLTDAGREALARYIRGVQWPLRLKLEDSCHELGWAVFHAIRDNPNIAASAHIPQSPMEGPIDSLPGNLKLSWR